MKKQILLAAAILFSACLQAQQLFVEKVSIEYAKTVAVKPLMKEMDPEWYDIIKDRLPQDLTGYYNFSGDGKKSIFKRTKEAEMPRNFSLPPFGDENVVYNDYTNGTTVSQKPIYEETFLVEDSLLKVEWKITADTRRIAGFDCRKAVGILYDTVAVFAFYTDEIMVNGGPEGISGLPGMILGLGIPRLHTTWFATKVNIATENEMKAVIPATKGKKTDRSKMISTLDSRMKSWSEFGRKIMLAYVI